MRRRDLGRKGTGSYLVRISEARDEELRRQRPLSLSEAVGDDSVTAADGAVSSAGELDDEWRRQSGRGEW